MALYQGLCAMDIVRCTRPVRDLVEPLLMLQYSRGREDLLEVTTSSAHWQ
jgi:hypothetical protein